MNDKTSLWPLLDKLGVEIKAEAKDLSGKKLMRRIMQAWLPAGEVLLDMLVLHLPSPATAQRYRVDNWTTSSTDPSTTPTQMPSGTVTLMGRC